MSSGDRSMGDIGNADRVALMQRLVALKVEHRDLDAVIQRLAERSGARPAAAHAARSAASCCSRIRSRWLERQIDPDVWPECRAEADRSGRHAPVLVVEADDVVLAEVVAALDLDHHQRVACRILQPMLRLDRNVRRAVGVDVERRPRRASPWRRRRRRPSARCGDDGAAATAPRRASPRSA